MSFDKRIVIVTPWFGEFAGGAEVLARGLALEFRRRGIETIVLTTCSRSPYDSWWNDYYPEGVYESYGVETHRFATNKTREGYERAVGKWVRRETLSKQEQADFFLCGINSDYLVESVKFYLHHHDEVIAMPYFQGLTHAVLHAYPGQISMTPCFHDEEQFYWDSTRLLLYLAKHIFYNTLEEKILCIRQYGQQIGRKVVESIVTGIGVELSKIENFQQQALALPSKYVLYIGRKERGKNVPLLCEWFSRYVEAYQSDISLVCIGGGDPSLLPTHQRIIDYGFVNEQEKQQVIRHATAVINLSVNESFSFVLMEAWMLAVPVIVSAHCAVTTGHVRRSNGGLYVNDAEEFMDTLSMLENNPSYANLMGQQGKQYVTDNFSFDLVLGKYLKVLAG